MIAYVDSSVLLRLILGQPGALPEWPGLETGVASELVEVECLRTVDRLRQGEAITAAESLATRQAIYSVVATLEIVALTRAVLARAGQPMPTPLGTLDALHLATALLWSETFERDLVMLTHDQALATAARATGLKTLGT